MQNCLLKRHVCIENEYFTPKSTCKHCGIYTGPSLLERYKSHNNKYIYKAAYNKMMNHVIIFLVMLINGQTMYTIQNHT